MYKRTIFLLIFIIFIINCLSLNADNKMYVIDILSRTGIKGGFIVHLNCGDGQLTSDLHLSDSYIVQGLDTDENNIKQARKNILLKRLYGKVTAKVWNGKTLPYINNLVNLIISEKPIKVDQKEIVRVLAPNGVAYLKEGKSWRKLIKPVPKAYDEWTHYTHGPDGNLVSKDTAVSFPRHIQWVGSPRYARHHDHMSSMNACVSAKGRVFYVMDEGSRSSILFPSKWKLIARDAYNGVILWKRDISSWHPRLWKLKSGPGTLPRRLVAIDDKVYATLGYNDPVTQLDAAKGKTLQIYKGTENTEEIIYSKGYIFCRIDKNPEKWELHDLPTERYIQNIRKKSIVSVDTKSGKILWDKEFKWVAPTSMVCDDKYVYFYDGDNIVALDRKTGKQKWSTEYSTTEQRKKTKPKKLEYGYTIVAHKDVILFSGGNQKIVALSAKNGEQLWEADQPPSGYRSPWDVFVIKNQVWYSATTSGKDSGEVTARDINTGKVTARFEPDVETHWFHHRCYRAKATEKYMLTSRTGIEFIDLKTKKWTIHHWTRGACLYGIMPANGMIYAPNHPCACYLVAKTYGFTALAPTSSTRKIDEKMLNTLRLFKGPAYGNITKRPAEKDEWPTYRGNNERSGYTTQKLSSKLKPKWKINIKGNLSRIVVAGKKLYVASIDEHILYALDSTTGKKQWSFQAGARIDSPPTIHEGKVLFGSVDGYVYCLRETDGELAWKFLGAPVDRQHMFFEQVESVWPIHGSVLVIDNKIYCTAGRSMFTDGGIRFICLNAETGERIFEKVLDDKDPATGDNLQVTLVNLNMPTALPDILSSDEKYIYMRIQKFDMNGKRLEVVAPADATTGQKGEDAHLFSPTGFLDDSFWHRTYWVFGRIWQSGAGGYWKAGRYTPSGRILVHDKKNIYGFGRKFQFFRWTTPMDHQLFGADKTSDSVNLHVDSTGKVSEVSPEEAAALRRGKRQQTIGPKGKKKKKKGGGSKAFPDTKYPHIWEKDIPIIVRSIALADTTMYIAGPEDILNEEEAFTMLDKPETLKTIQKQNDLFDGKGKSYLYSVSATDGKILNKMTIDSLPAFDGMAVAYGNLYMVTKSGDVICLGK